MFSVFVEASQWQNTPKKYVFFRFKRLLPHWWVVVRGALFFALKLQITRFALKASANTIAGPFLPFVPCSLHSVCHRMAKESPKSTFSFDLSDFCTLCGNLYHSARKMRSNRVILPLVCPWGVKCCFACRISHPKNRKQNFCPSRVVVVVVVGKRNFSRALQQKQQQQKMRNEFFLLLSFVGFPFPFSLFLWFFWLFLGFGWVFLGYGWVFLGYGWLFLGFLKRCKSLIFKPFRLANLGRVAHKAFRFRHCRVLTTFLLYALEIRHRVALVL